MCPLKWRHMERHCVSNHRRRLFVPQLVQVNNSEQNRTPYHWPFAREKEIAAVISGFPSQRASNAERVSMSWHHHTLGSQVTVFGTPAEEGGAGKVDLIDAGSFADVHLSMMAHPSPNTLSQAPKNAMLEWVNSVTNDWNPVSTLPCYVFKIPALIPIDYSSYKSSTSVYIDGSAQDCSNSSALEMELLQSCTKLPVSWVHKTFVKWVTCVR